MKYMKVDINDDIFMREREKEQRKFILINSQRYAH